MGGALACCTKLKKELDLNGTAGRGRCGDGGARRRARQRRGARARARLKLNDNKIGDEGVRHLGDALARGAAPALESSTSTATRSATRGCATCALARGAAPALQDAQGAAALGLLDGAFLVAHLADAKGLNCSELGWGDEEARRLAAALEHAHAQGALKALEALDLGDEQARGAAPALTDRRRGDEGMRHLADALARGAAPALKDELGLYGNPASDDAQQARGRREGHALPGIFL